MFSTKMLACVALLGAILGAKAEDTVTSQETKEQMHYRKRGGDIERPDSFKGKVVFVDTQDKVPHSAVAQAAKTLCEATECNILAEKSEAGKPTDLMKKLGATIVVVVVDDEASPAMLLAPEDHWGVVNVSKLVGDLPTEKAKNRFIGTRTTKEVIRAFSLLCGGGSSQFNGNMMNAATLRQLDTTVDTIPVDMIDYYQRYLKEFGVTKREITNYKTACKEGWAPAPTNDVQKAIWDRYHELPSKGIEIKFDPKKGE